MDPPPPPYPSPYPPPQFYPPPVVATTINTVSSTPAISPIASEGQNNNIPTHVAANPSPPPANPVSNHPPYAEMICAAITALKEKDGSSKRAIAKYIERVYSGLPPTHPSLLTHHLKRLKNNGLLVMVKKSYKLPRSDASAPPPTDSAAAVTATATAALPSAGPSRARGRPPKTKPIPDQQPNSQQQFIPIPQQPNFQQQPIPIPQQFQQLLPISQQPILQQPIPIPHQLSLQQPIPQPTFQAFPAEPTEQPTSQPDSQPMLVALGLVDEPSLEKRRPGRPRKVAGAVVGQASGAGSVSAKRGRGRPPGSRLSKKRPGRPPKVKSVSSAGPNGLVKRGRGRPSKAEPKSVFFPYATNVPLMGAFEQNNVPKVEEAQQPSSRPRGRPRKDPAIAAAVRVGGLVPGKRGRPPGLPGIERPSRRTGRPVGRPKKSASMAKNEAPDSKSVDNGEFKRKLEYFQSKVGQAVSALKPYLNHESTGDVVSAIQELDVLATMDITAPLNVEVHQPVLQN